MNQVTGATAVAPGANHGLDLNCTLPVAGLCLYGILQRTHAHMQAVAALQQLACVLEPSSCATAALGQAFVTEGRDEMISTVPSNP